MVKMIITDLEDTLLRSDKTISDYTVNIIKKCQATGIKVIFATARSAKVSEKSLERFMPDVFVGYGGTLATADDKIIYRSDIPADIAGQIMKESLKTLEVV